MKSSTDYRSFQYYRDGLLWVVLDGNGKRVCSASSERGAREAIDERSDTVNLLDAVKARRAELGIGG